MSGLRTLCGIYKNRAGINEVYKELDKIMRERRQKGADDRMGVKLECVI